MSSNTNNDSEGAVVSIPTDPTFDLAAAHAALECNALLWRTDEMFAEFGCSLAHPSTQIQIGKWHLRVHAEGKSGDYIYDDELPTKQATKVIKLKPSTAYVFKVRVFSDTHQSWGPWSAEARTMTLATVVTSIKEIGEDYVRIMWDRPLRQDKNIAEEIDKDATSMIADIKDFELRVVRESDMVQEFSDVFAAGVRTYTLHELRPATAYIVLARYETLIGTKKQWYEVCRFYSQASHESKLRRRGEDTFSVEWARAPLPEQTVGYLLPDSTIHRFEVSVEGDGADEQPVELAASTKQFTASKLCPGATYAFRVRCLTKEGRWGARAKPLMIRLADRPTVRPLAIGETFLSIGWTRPHHEDDETKVEYEISHPLTGYRRSQTLEISGEEKDRVVHIDGLQSGTMYDMTIRTYLVNEWGLWSEPRRIRTSPKASVVFKERGEDFLTVDWSNNLFGVSEEERRVMSQEGRYLFKVSRVDSDGDRQPVLEEEIQRKTHGDGLRIGSLVPDTQYEVKCSAWQRNPITKTEGWGEFSAPLLTQTLQSVALQVLDVGEDFAQLSWRRSLRTADVGKSISPSSSSSASAQHVWMDLKYEIVVACLDTGNDCLVHKEVLDTTYTITNLLPNTNYVISVRACDEKEQWGLWCRLLLRTLAAIDTSIHEVGEDFVRLMWQRNTERDADAMLVVEEQAAVINSGPAAGGASGAAGGEITARHATPRSVEQYVAQYAVFVFSDDVQEVHVPHKEAQYYRGGNSESAVLEHVASHHSSCRIGSLLPDRDYVMVVRALTSSGKWGLWSKPIRFRTVSQFRIPVNFLSIGENYVHIIWNRDEHPAVDPDVVLGDFTVVAQQLRIVGVDNQYSKDHALDADLRELKLYGLSPTTAYSIQLRACGRTGEWGLWSTPVHLLTRATITTRPVEVAEDYLVLSWERKRAPNPKNYPTGKGLVTSYHLRVSNAAEGVCMETFLGDGDCPYRIAGLKPDTYYCVELKANYNDEEWGLWSTPLWCLTMRHLDVKTQLISEEFCTVKVIRPSQNKRLPEDDGNRVTEDRVIAFGQVRSHCMLCVTTPPAAQAPHHAGAAGGARSTRPSVSSALPADCQGHRLVYQVELICEHEELVHTIPNLKANTMYHASVRSKLDSSEWGMWSSPSLRFASVPTISVGFAAIGENYITAEWRRGAQNIPPALLSKVQCGLGIISKSRLKLRDMSSGSATRIFDIDSSANQLYIDDLAPASTYAISVQTFNDNFAWGMWSEDAKVRTVPSMDIIVEHITEDAVWVSWNRRPDLSQPIAHDTVLNVDSNVKNYEVKIVGDGHFCFTRELESNKLFFRGLQPDTIYELKVRALNKNDGHWGLWSSQYFRTQPMMRITFGNIGEHFAVVEWRRHLPQSAHWDPNATSLIEAEDLVQEFRLKVEKVGEEPVIHELSPNISSFRFTNLMPSAEYRVWMCAKGHEGVWGLWNEEARVRTLPQLDLTVKDIGEDYVSVSWTRLKWDGERAPDAAGVKVWEIDGAVSGYHVKILDIDGNVFAQQHMSYTTTSCTLSHLNLKSIYSIQVCAKDTYNEWGLWSETRRFVTLQPVKMSLLRIGEDHVDIEWGRRGQIRRRFITEVVSDAEMDDGDDEDDDGTNLPIPLSAGSDGAMSPGDTDPIDPNHQSSLEHPGSEVFEDSFGSVAELEEDIIRGDEVVKQWHVRVYGRRIFGGQPGSEDYVEFFVGTAVTEYHISSLLPKATYSLAVRAQNSHGEWGHWCHAETVVTMPLLTLELDYIGETFLLASWARPKHDHSHLVCFPAPMGNHNYQVQIHPMASEDPFDPQDEPLIEGARVYETTQPSLQLSNLRPGCRYRVTVREEMINPLEPDVRPLVPNFGVFCEATIVETIEPTVIDPNEIGEDYCAVSWGRRGRNRTTAHSDDTETVVASLVRSKARVIGYEVQAVRLDDNADQVYKGPLALELMKAFPGTTQEFKLVHLAPNAIYGITARAQTEGGYWGLWSAPSKFVTQKRLTLHVELINEDSCVVSWAREMPDWAIGQEVLRLHSATPDVDASSSIAGDDEDFNEDAESANTTPPPPVNPMLESVIIGDYSVNLFEVVVEGINHTFEQKLVLPNAKMSARISGLTSNLIYTISIRSMSERENWSLFSPKVSVCTLRGMELTIKHYSENLGAVEWHRQGQSIAEHTKYLNKLRENMTREAEHHERKERFEMEQERLSQEAIGDDDEAPSNATTPAATSTAAAATSATTSAAGGAAPVVLSFQERVRQLEHYMASVSEMTHCLIPENVHLGKAEVTGYQLQLHGAGGTPFISGTSHLMASTKKRGSSRKKAAQGVRASGSVNSNASGGRAPLPSRAAPRSGRQSSMSNAAAEEESIAVELSDDNVLLDSKINAKTNTVCILGLQEGTNYELSVRARNLHQEWGPWSDRTQLVTLKLLNLCHTRFGEHYINLFWHRIPQSEIQLEHEQKATLAKFEAEFKDITPKDLEGKKQTLDPADYHALVARIREWKTLQRAMIANAANICDGLGTVEAAPNTPVRGYHLRIVHENGSIRDAYFEDAGVNKGHQFTVTGLQPNTMYVAMLCADYGLGEWGAWSDPIRFMTQNLIQLQLSYVGESFIDIEWRRAPNKKLARVDDGLVLVNPTTQGRGHQYEVCIRSLNPETAEEAEERRSMTDCSKFRIEHLLTDTKYTLTVREWDAKGEWGLWSGARVCCTLAGMDASVHEIGENWVQLSWSRRPRRKLPGDADNNITQLPVEAVAFYLRVEELHDNGYELDARDNDDSTGSPTAEPHDSPKDDGHEEDIASLLDHHRGSTAEDDIDVEAQGPLPLPPPTECDPDDDDVYSTPGGGAGHRRRRYVNIKKFSYDTNEMNIDNLRPDTFYNVQVLCETTGGQLGTWSSDRFILSLAKIRLRTDLIDEQNVRLSWSRDLPRHHPRLNAPVVTGAFHTETYDLEAYGHEKKNTSYHVAQQFPSNTQEYKLSDLMLNSAYRVRVRGTDNQGRLSLWSDDLHCATLKPLRVLTGKILEHHASIEWGRDPQSATDYPPTTTPMLFGVERANQYHIRVYTPHERTVPLADKQFAGTVTRYNLVNLAPNACYVVQARSCNVIGEWGLWSEERVVYTMKLVELDITAVGEDYIKVSWRREEPDELQEMVQVEKAALDDVDDEALVDEAALKALMMRKRYPLLDKPTDRNAAHQAVYASARTSIFTYTLSITKRGETEDIIMEVPAATGGGRSTSSWTVSHLRPDTQYSIAIRAYYGDEDWGLWSERVVSGTMNLLAADVKYVGEDYLSASWQRMATSYPTTSDTRIGKPEETLCYEFKLFDFSDVPIGEEAAADLDALQVREVLVAKLKVATIKALRSNRRYRMCVRRWYHPIEEAGALVPVMEESEKPLSEEQRLRALMERNHGTPGAWSDAVFAITLKDMVVLVDEIAEDSLSIRWDRDPNAAVLPTRQCLKVPTVVLSYHVRIDAMTSDGAMVDNAANTLHLDHVFGPEETSNVVPDLRPDAVYKVDVRCCTDKVWGQWSRTVYVVTLPKLTITLQSIGEDYVSLLWARHIRSLTLPDGTPAVVGHQNNVEKYHMDMTGVDHHFRLEKKFKASRTSYRVKHLEAQTVYHIAVRSCDIHGTWSLWSEAVVFATLKPLRLNLGKAGEQFVHVSWDRPEQTVEEYQHVDPNIQLGNTSVLSYHLCAFAMDQAPSTAVVDKQFHGDVSKYRITTLTPNTSYIIIVRACNDESQWGLWSEERIIRTQRILTLQVGGIGENYVKVRWEREESDGGVQNGGATDAPTSDSTLGLPSSFHLAITSEVETVDRHFTLEECNTSNELRLPEYLTNNLTPDTKYLIALQPCYGNDEWGLWTKPLTFVTLNRISIMTTSVSESKVELAWGRAQQSVELAADPNIVTWRGTIVKYQLLMRKVEEMNAAARRERERALHPTVVAESDMDPAVEGAARPQPEGTSDALVVAGSGEQPRNDSVALVDESGASTAAPKRRQSLVQEPDELRIERDIDVKQVKYVQTSCTIDSLMLNTDYHVQVRALDDAGEWGCWTELLFDTPPPPPTNVNVRKSGAQFCLVTWDAPDVVNRYQHIVEQAVMKETTTRRGRVDMSDWKVVDTVEEPQSRIRAFGPMNKIRFRVKSCKLDRPTHIMSQYSDIVGMSTSNPPEPVGSLAVATLARNSATVEWSKPAPAPGEAPPSAGAERGSSAQQPQSTVAYRVLLSVKEQPPVLLTTTKNLTYTLNDLEPNTAYKVQVQVEADSGISQKNVVLRFTTKAESDRTVSRAQAGQPPLGMIISRPGTQEGANSGQEAVRLPAIAIASAQGGAKRGTSPLGKARTRSTSGGKKPMPPKPPQDNAARRAPRNSPKRAAGGVVSPAKRGGSPPGRAAGGSPNVAPTRPPVPRPKDASLPPVRSRQGAPQGKGPVEQFDFVEFQPSDDEDK